MKKTTTPSKKRTTQKSAKAAPVVLQTSADLRTALLVLSLIVNLFLLCVWVVVRVDPQYDQALSMFFFGR